ncbi:hypothetical protein FIBSPDRAFT_331427 [Athelia psychrophila]|uniref:Zn(2)-C6 fungal-type domain-containing protein n=1 Tax=Athelia psychrophila TaxID=1759441 RepID=A0A167WGB6_9AGAM|nr:hypothetical protein FIBSPDRAFT_331427 [Fibularhizoctonia sp. CBS 109695]
MPAEPKNTSSSRRNVSRKLTSNEEDLKRSRGEISCAECRRSKLKCDKQIPCGSCARRGCSSLCPNDIFTHGQSAKSFPGMDQLHRKIAEMAQRIRQLEDALAILQSSVSNEPHALLADDLLSKSPALGPPGAPKDMLTETTDAFGTLTVDDHGEAKYLGPSAGLENLLLPVTAPPTDNFDAENSAPALLNSLACMCSGPEGASDLDTVNSAMALLFEGLPPRNRAWSLCETYLEHTSWLFQVTTRSELIEEILTPIFNAKKEREDSAFSLGSCAQISPHKFACLYLVFAHGILVDLTLPAYHADSEKYHQYARAAMALRSFTDSPTVETVQAILMMLYYRSSAGGERYTRDGVWLLGSLGCKLTQSLGMHRDPARWHMDEKTAEFRRRIFWEVYTADLFDSLSLGRPPSIELSYVDCKHPTGNDSEDFDTQFWKWKYQFIRDVFGSVLKLTLSATPPSYKAILELDCRIREMVLPPALNIFLQAEGEDADLDTGSFMKGCLLAQFRSFSMIFIHRRFFAQALLGHPENPLQSPYATSFLAMYRAATAIIRVTLKHADRHQDFFQRWWLFWAQLFSAAVVVGSVATKAPSSNMASSAFMELGLAVDLFERGAGTSERAKAALDILKKLKEKAFLVLSQHRNSTNSDSPSPSPTSSIFNTQEGHTRWLFSKTLTTNQAGAIATPPASSNSAPLSSRLWPDQGDSQEIHPSLVYYASLFPPKTPSTDFNGHPVPDFESPSLDQSTATDNSFVPSTWNAQMSSHLQTEISSQMGSSSLPNDPSSYNPLQQLYQETPLTSLDTWGSNAMSDIGQMMGIDSDMGEQWMDFMKDCGIVNATTLDT